MSILWVIAGYSLAFSQGTSILVGNLSKLFLEIAPDSNVGTISKILFLIYTQVD